MPTNVVIGFATLVLSKQIEIPIPIPMRVDSNRLQSDSNYLFISKSLEVSLN